VQLVDQQLGSATNDRRLCLIDDELARHTATVLRLEGIDHCEAERRIAPNPVTLLDASQPPAHRAPVNLAAFIGRAKSRRL